MTDPYQSPQADLGDHHANVQYAGFWARVLAYIVDVVIMVFIFIPIVYFMYGADYFMSEDPSSHAGIELISSLAFLVLVVWMWSKFGATPGKMLVGAKIVDVETNGPASVGKLVLRYFGYILSSIPLMLGFFWIGWDAKKQGWHDKLSGTAVIKD